MDPVRYISNRSSGKMGYTIAEAALDAGHDVVLISGPVNLAPPRNTKFISVSTSDEMFEAVHRHARESDICVLCAAVADYKPAKVSPAKIKKRGDRMSLELVTKCDIIVANDARIGMESDENELLILFRNGETKRLSRAPKTFLSRELVKIFLKFATKTFDKKNVMITERT